MKLIKFILLIILVLQIVFTYAQTYKNKTKVISSTGGESSGNNYSNFGVAGEPMVNFFAISGNYEASIGFLYKADIWTEVVENNNDEMKAYPNPTADYLTLLNNPSESNIIELYDMHGNNQIISFHNNHIDISKLPDGLYLLQVINKNGSLVHKEKILKN